MKDCFIEPPAEAGTYNVSVVGVRSFAPIFWHFDGIGWAGADTKPYLDKPLGPGMAFWYEGTKQEK